MVTARKMHELGLAETSLTESGPLEVAPRPLTATELIADTDAHVLADVARPELDLSQVRELTPRAAGRNTA
jgi:DNA recombination protein RmuC